MKLKFFISIIAIFFCAFANSQGVAPLQRHKIDSLLKVIKKRELSFSPEFKGSMYKNKFSIPDTFYLNALNELGWQLSNNHPDTAILLSSQALTIANELIGDSKLSYNERCSLKKTIASAENYLGLYARSKNNYSKALEYHLKAMAIADSLGNIDLLAATLDNIGVVYGMSGNRVQAKYYCKKAFETAKIAGSKRSMAIALGNLGIICGVEMDYDKAMDYNLLALKLVEELNDSVEMARYYGNIGTTYHNWSRALQNDNGGINRMSFYNKALSFYEKALHITESLNDKQGTAYHLGNIGFLLVENKNYKKAEVFMHKSIALAQELNIYNLEINQLESLSLLYQETNNTKKAFDYYKKFVHLKDSVFNKENTENLLKVKMNFEFDKRQAELKAEQEKENLINQRKILTGKLWLLFVSVFLIMFSASAFVIYKRLKVTQAQKGIIESQKEKIIDSINYAKLIQDNILIDENEMRNILGDSFVIYKPKDIVSGDFYWICSVDEKVVVAVADCTGHGVPGAFMSMLGNTLLKQIVKEKMVTKPSEILKQLSENLYETLHQNKNAELMGDGMDIAICTIDYIKQELQYAGAKNSLYYTLNKNINVVNADNKTIGVKLNLKKQNFEGTNFTNNLIPLTKGMNVYLFTDGYIDQFGGKEDTKYGSTQLKELIGNIEHLTMEEQKKAFEVAHMTWKGERQQIDDILLLGIKI